MVACWRVWVIGLVLLAVGVVPWPTQALRLVGSGGGGVSAGVPDPLKTVAIQDQGGAVHNVLAYGADPTGTIDSTAVFTSLLGTHMYVPPGVYLVGRLALTSYTTIECSGWDAIIKLPPDQDPLTRNLWIGNSDVDPVISHVTIRNCQFDGSKGASGSTTGSALGPNGVNITVENNYIHSIAKACVNMGRASGASHMRVLDNWCHNPGLSGTGWGAFAFTGGSHLLMQGNVATSDDGFMYYGYSIESNTGWNMDNVVLAENISQRGSFNVIQASGSTVTDVVMNGNYADATSAAGAGAGCRLQNLAGPVTFTGNTCIGPASTSPGLLLDGATTGVVISGNTLVFPGESQVTNANAGALTFQNTVGDVTVSGNRLVATGRSSDGTPFCINDRRTGTGVITYGTNTAVGCHLHRPQPGTSATAFRAVPERIQRTGATYAPIGLTPMMGVGDMATIVPWSDAFNGHWTIGSGLTVTDAAITDPLGTTTGAQFVADGTANSHQASLAISQAATTGDWWVMSLWLKTASGTVAVPLELEGNITGTLARMTATATTTWQRVELAGIANGSDTTLTLRINEGGASVTFHVWRVMLSPGQQAPATLPVTAGSALTLSNTLLSQGPVVLGSTVKIGSLTTSGSAGGKRVVCVDITSGQLFASSTGTDCSN